MARSNFLNLIVCQHIRSGGSRGATRRTRSARQKRSASERPRAKDGPAAAAAGPAGARGNESDPIPPQRRRAEREAPPRTEEHPSGPQATLGVFLLLRLLRLFPLIVLLLLLVLIIGCVRPFLLLRVRAPPRCHGQPEPSRPQRQSFKLSCCPGSRLAGPSERGPP